MSGADAVHGTAEELAVTLLRLAVERMLDEDTRVVGGTAIAVLGCDLEAVRDGLCSQVEMLNEKRPAPDGKRFAISTVLTDESLKWRLTIG